MLPNRRPQSRPRIDRPRGGRPARPHAALALLALALLAAPHAARAQVQPQAAMPPLPSSEAELKVMTWNVRGGQARKSNGRTQTLACRPNLDDDYLNGIAREIRGHAALDVVALQEVYRRQAESLRRKLAGHLGTSPSLYFVATVRCDRDRLADDYGIAIISRHQFTEGGGESVRLCRTLFDRPFGFDMPYCPRNEQRVLARVVIRVEGRPIHVYNTHLPPGVGVHGAMANLIIRQVARDRADRPRGSAFRAVLLGDFYAKPGSAGYDAIRRSFRDAWLGASHDPRDCDAKGLTHPTLSPTTRSDYVFVGDGFRVDDARVTCTGDLLEVFGLPGNGRTRDGEPIFKKVPDHLPLTARLTVL